MIEAMKGIKGMAGVLGATILLASCNSSNTLKGSLIGAGGGTALGAGIGALIGKATGNAGKGAAIGAAVGVAAGTTAGALIGRKMDKAKAAAAASLADAQVETTKDANGLDAVKVTLENGILFAVGKYTLQSAAQASLKKFASEVLKVYTDCDVSIQGFASSDGSDATNLTLSQNRANAVCTYLVNTCNVNAAQIASTVGFGEDPAYLIMGADGKEDREASRRVEIYLYASQAMIDAANNGTLE